jgi:TatD DNase family protein
VIDCHAHLASDAFDSDRDAVIERARRAGVRWIVVVGEDAEDDRRVLDVARSHERILLPCVGFHPDRFAEEREVPGRDDIEEVVALARAEREHWVAIGEVGLDYFWVKTDERRAAQRRCLEAMVALSVELDLPLNVHSRSAGHHAIDVLVAAGAKRVLMHAFDGKAGYAQRAAERHGFVFSIPPSVVRSAQKQKLVRALPLESLALETDSPVLGPEPNTRNEPANLGLVVEAIANLKRTSADRVCEAARQSTRRVFGVRFDPTT